MTQFGSITVEAGSHTLRFERSLAFPPDEVWAALTEPSRLAEWLARATVLPGPGGEITLDFGEGGTEGGRITAWKPPALLEYEWNFGESPTHVRWELEAVEQGRSTRLTLVHTLLQPEVSPGYGAGWHAHLDQLEGHLSGTALEWDSRFEELRPHYVEIAASTA
jgi:uncharacterized protein YndB with AHSA1/START domain